jgi:hypothetical protein
MSEVDALMRIWLKPSAFLHANDDDGRGATPDIHC